MKKAAVRLSLTTTIPRALAQIYKNGGLNEPSVCTRAAAPPHDHSVALYSTITAFLIITLSMGTSS